ncbi:MAG: LysE family translocator [Pseudomonadota bacterium]
MFEFLDEWLILIVAFGIAVISPGPDLVMAIRNSILGSRTAGIFTAFGFGLGVCVHVIYSLVGISALIAQSVMLFTIIKYMGAAYLIFIGIKALKSKGFKMDKTNKNSEKIKMTALQGLCRGFITNLLNPKATMFFLALFTQLLDPQTPISVQIAFGVTCVVMCTSWFCFVAIVLTNEKIQKRFIGFTKWIDRLCGGLLVALGIRLAM